MKYDGGLFCSLVCDNNPTMEEKYPPGTRVKWMDPSTNMLFAGTVMDIPLPIDDSASTGPPLNHPYSILFNNGTTAFLPLLEMTGVLDILVSSILPLSTGSNM
jgi:hypothetical protein